MTQRIPLVQADHVSATAERTLRQVEKAIGRVPNLHRTLANAPAALDAYVAMGGALSRGVLDARLREQVAVTIAGLNDCNYCASAHVAIGEGLDLERDELLRNLSGASTDDRTSAVLAFARSVLERRGAVADEELQAVRDAGFDDGEILEIVAHVAMNVLTNMVNSLARTEIDFPRIEGESAA